MARMMALCSLPRTNPGNQHRYVRRNGPYTLVMSATGLHKLPFGNLPRLIFAWLCRSPLVASALSAGPTDGPWAQREASLQRIRKVGRRKWQKESGYRQQARVENSFFRYKSVFGGGLKARHSKAQRREAAIGSHILNRMAELSR